MSTTDFTHTLQLLTEMMAVQQRSLMDAQLATYKHLTQLYTPQAPSESQRANLSSHVDDTLSASQSLMLAHVQAGNDVMALSEKLVSELNRQLVHSLHQSVYRLVASHQTSPRPSQQTTPIAPQGTTGQTDPALRRG